MDKKEFQDFTCRPLDWDIDIEAKECKLGPDWDADGRDHYTPKSSTVQQKKPVLNTGVKYDHGKLRWDLLPMGALEEVVRVYTKGAEKYEDWNWAKGMDYSRVYAALNRHLKAWWWDGEDLDKETQCQHLASVVWCALSLLHSNIHKNNYNKNHNDRPGFGVMQDQSQTPGGDQEEKSNG